MFLSSAVRGNVLVRGAAAQLKNGGKRWVSSSQTVGRSLLQPAWQSFVGRQSVFQAVGMDVRLFSSKDGSSASSSSGLPSLAHGEGPMTQEEEQLEKARADALTDYQKEMELRQLDRSISRLNTLRGINTGELYTLRGKFKALARDYGVGFMVWYWCVWTTTACLTYGAIELGNVDAIALIGKIDNFTGYEISSKVDPTLGTIGLTIAINECLEPLRLPIVVLTTKPVVNFFTGKTD